MEPSPPDPSHPPYEPAAPRWDPFRIPDSEEVAARGIGAYEYGLATCTEYWMAKITGRVPETGEFDFVVLYEHVLDMQELIDDIGAMCRTTCLQEYIEWYGDVAQTAAMIYDVGPEW